MSAKDLLAEIELELGRAARRAWRQLQPDWRAIEADVALATAVAAMHRMRPELSAEATLAELHRLELVAMGPGGVVVKVPELPHPQLPTAGLQ